MSSNDEVKVEAHLSDLGASTRVQGPTMRPWTGSEWQWLFHPSLFSWLQLLFFGMLFEVVGV
jgi:hypothetical protein